MGSLLTGPLEALLEKNREFGMFKTCGLLDECCDCACIKLCFGGCPKDRVRRTGSGGGRSYLCESYRMFFRAVAEWHGERQIQSQA